MLSNPLSPQHNEGIQTQHNNNTGPIAPAIPADNTALNAITQRVDTFERATDITEAEENKRPSLLKKVQKLTTKVNNVQSFLKSYEYTKDLQRDNLRAFYEEFGIVDIADGDIELQEVQLSDRNKIRTQLHGIIRPPEENGIWDTEIPNAFDIAPRDPETNQRECYTACSQNGEFNQYDDYNNLHHKYHRLTQQEQNPPQIAEAIQEINKLMNLSNSDLKAYPPHEREQYEQVKEHLEKLLEKANESKEHIQKIQEEQQATKSQKDFQEFINKLVPVRSIQSLQDPTFIQEQFLEPLKQSVISGIEKAHEKGVNPTPIVENILKGFQDKLGYLFNEVSFAKEDLNTEELTGIDGELAQTIKAVQASLLNRIEEYALNEVLGQLEAGAINKISQTISYSSEDPYYEFEKSAREIISSEFRPQDLYKKMIPLIPNSPSEYNTESISIQVKGPDGQIYDIENDNSPFTLYNIAERIVYNYEEKGMSTDPLDPLSILAFSQKVYERFHGEDSSNPIRNTFGFAPSSNAYSDEKPDQRLLEAYLDHQYSITQTKETSRKERPFVTITMSLEDTQGNQHDLNIPPSLISRLSYIYQGMHQSRSTMQNAMGNLRSSVGSL